MLNRRRTVQGGLAAVGSLSLAAPFDARAQGSRASSRPPIAHAEDPAHPGTALCGAKLRHSPTSAGSERCVVCRDLTRRTFFRR